MEIFPGVAGSADSVIWPFLGRILVFFWPKTDLVGCKKGYLLYLWVLEQKGNALASKQKVRGNLRPRNLAEMQWIEILGTLKLEILIPVNLG